MGDEERRPRPWTDAAHRCNHLAYADDLILMAQGPRDIQHMYIGLE